MKRLLSKTSSLNKISSNNEFEKKTKELNQLLDEINRFMKSKENKIKQLMKEIENYYF